MKLLTIALLATSVLAGQSGDIAFEAATIKPAAPDDGHGFVVGCRGGPGTTDPALWRCTNAPISMMVLRAFDIQRYQLTAPDYVGSTRFEISARIPPNTTKEQFREMIRNLLKDRFKLEFHWVKKDMAMYDLVVGKGGPKLQKSVAQPEPDGSGAGPRRLRRARERCRRVSDHSQRLPGLHHD